MTDTTRLQAKSRTLTLSNGRQVVVSPFTAKHFILDDKVPNAIADISEFLRTLGAQVAGAVDADGNVNLAAVPVERVLRDCRKPIAVLLKEAVPLGDEFFAELGLDDVLLLAGAILLVNQESLGNGVGAAVQALSKLAAAPANS